MLKGCNTGLQQHAATAQNSGARLMVYVRPRR